MNIAAKFSGGMRYQNNTSTRIFTAQRCGFPLSAKSMQARNYHFFNGAKTMYPKSSNMSAAETQDNGLERDKKMNGMQKSFLCIFECTFSKHASYI